MGCSHYNQRANTLQSQIDVLETDKTNLTELQSLVATASSNIESYKSFFSSIHAILQRMIVNGVGFDADNCSSQISSLDGVASELSELSGQIATQLPLLEEKITEKKAKKEEYLQSWCSTCLERIQEK